jgi:hypothetical protein
VKKDVDNIIRDFIDQERQHMAMEERVVFPAALNALRPKYRSSRDASHRGQTIRSLIPRSFPRTTGIGHSRRPTRTTGLPAVSITIPCALRVTLVSGALAKERGRAVGGRAMTAKQRKKG